MDNIEQLERRLWEAADQLRANSKLTSTEYYMPVLGLIFLRHAYTRYLSVKAEIEPKLPKRGGVARPQLPNRDIERIRIPIPAPSEQLRVAILIGNYDDLIENKLRRIALLEESARRLYKEWFVRLRLPGSERTGSLKRDSVDADRDSSRDVS